MLKLDIVTLISFLLASLPAIVWSILLLKSKRKQYRSLYLKIFLAGTLTVVPIIAMQLGYFKLISKHPNLDFVFTLKNLVGPSWWIIVLYSFVSITEEIVKFYIIRFSDKTHPELITNINQSLKFGILSALGFAFSENILYFNQAWQQGFNILIPTVLFRSTFTVCAHICFTGIFSYYYGISKFSKDFVDVKKWQGEPVAINEYQKLKNRNIFTGLSLSILFHTLFNVTLELGQNNTASFNYHVVIAVLLVAGMFLFLQHLLSRKTGNLTFILADKHHSTMAKKDEEVILELIGMWYKEGRYEEVEGICERLLKRDPDNNVVKIFRAKTQDKLYTEN